MRDEPFLLVLLIHVGVHHHTMYNIFTHLREGAFFPTEPGARLPLVFRLPELLEELKSASLPAGRAPNVFSIAG